MAEITEPVFMTDRWAAKIGQGFKAARCGVSNWRQKQARQGLEADLAEIITTANGHHAKKVARGAEVYTTLEKKANNKITAFCKKWEVEEIEIRAQAPALRELHELTVPEVKTPVLAKLLLGLVLALVAVVVIGFSTGVIHNIFERSYNSGSHLLHK
jgi:hypothetical protein